MSRVFDYNGTIVAPSNPVKQLKTTKKMLIIDSGDRDVTKYPTNGDFVVYLPRVYENVVSLRLAGAELPSNAPLAKSNGTTISAPLYFILDIEGLNKIDECSVGADRSGYPDGLFAKIPTAVTSVNPVPIYYNDHSAPENIAFYSPAIGKLDRMHLRIRTHAQKQSGDYVYWGEAGNYSLTFEIEMLDNSFDSFSSFESRIQNRA
jgi:hypothetical protein